MRTKKEVLEQIDVVLDLTRKAKEQQDESREKYEEYIKLVTQRVTLQWVLKFW